MHYLKQTESSVQRRILMHALERAESREIQRRVRDILVRLDDPEQEQQEPER
jgi:hypothetical protein